MSPMSLTDPRCAGPLVRVLAAGLAVTALLVLTANHTLMHAGQFSVVRRALNKPVVM